MADEKRHPLYIEADGGIGKWDAEVYLGFSPRQARRNSDCLLLARLSGVRKEFRRGQGGPDSLRLDFITEATDFEHDRAHLVDIWLSSPYVGLELDDFQVIAGFGFELRIPTQEWLDEQLSSTEMCELCHGGEDDDPPHQIVEYLPPIRKEVDALGYPFLIVELSCRGTLH